MAVKLVVDSSSDITETQAKELGITMLPMPISFGEEEFLDGVNISLEQFYEKLATASDLPKTSQINEYRFEEAFEKHITAGDEVVAIVLSSKLSATCNSAKQAAEKFNGKVYVVDSLSASAGIKILVKYALTLVEQGKTAKEIYDILEVMKNKVQVMAMVDTLKYLKKGGRVSPLVAFAGELLGIKPMVSLINGKVEVIGKCMGLKKSILFMNNEIEKRGGINLEMPLYVLYSGADQEKANKYIQDNAEKWGNNSSTISKNCLGATIGTHVGPGAIGIAFFSK